MKKKIIKKECILEEPISIDENNNN